VRICPDRLPAACSVIYSNEDQQVTSRETTYANEYFRASSTWKHDTRRFGPQNALDSQSDDAWKSAPSEESDPLAYYEVYFHRSVLVREMRVQFQGGFVGMDCMVYKKIQQQPPKIDEKHDETNNNDEEEWEELDELFLDPKDSTDIQTFCSDELTVDPCTALRIEFGKSTDFYGRIVIYSLEVWGLEIPK
jgi:hypothetical protein